MGESIQLGIIYHRIDLVHGQQMRQFIPLAQRKDVRNIHDKPLKNTSHMKQYKWPSIVQKT
jgi:hypothetical protein